MAEMTTGGEQIVKHLNALIALDYDAIEAYEAAIERLQSGADKEQLRAFLADHRRHVLDLTPLVTELRGQPVTQADFKRILTKGKVVLGGLMGDRAILEAMQSNEETAAKSYQKAANEPGLPAKVRSVIDRNLGDERRHLGWIQQRLAASAHAERRQ